MRVSRAGRRFLFVSFLAASLLTALVVQPFVGALFAAAVLATVLSPVQERVSAAFGNRPGAAAATLLLTLSLVVLLPFSYAIYAGGMQLASFVGESIDTLEEHGVEGLVAELPEGIRPYALRLAQAIPAIAERSGERDAETAAATPASGDQVDVAAAVTATARITKRAGTWMAGLAVDLGVLLVALFFMLVQGRELLGWVVDAVPLPARQTRGFVAEFAEVISAVFMSTVVTAFVQTAVAAAGYLLAGIPMLLVVLLLTWTAALIPVVGGASIVVAVGALRLAAGDSGWGLFLLAWGLLPVALCDNVLKPLLAKGKLRLPGAVLFFAMLGGIAWMGPTGIIGGPLIVSFFLVTLRSLESLQAATAKPRGANGT